MLGLQFDQRPARLDAGDEGMRLAGAEGADPVDRQLEADRLTRPSVSAMSPATSLSMSPTKRSVRW